MGTARTETAGEGGRASGPVEVFPGVRVDREAGLVEFDAIVPINAHAPDGSVVFLEVIACRRDSKEHEALAMTDAQPSHVHAALLLLGLEAGATGGWRWEGESLIAFEPSGAALKVGIAWEDSAGAWVEHDALDLVVSRGDGRTFAEFMHDTPKRAPGEGASREIGPSTSNGGTSDADAPAFVFAGSRFVQRQGREVYDADGTGQIVGLHTFSSEVVGLTRVLSPESSVLEPEWIARAELLPFAGTQVVVRIRVPRGEPAP